MDVCVVLMGGSSVHISITAECPVAELQQTAQNLFHTGKGKLITASGEVLNPAHTISECGVQPGDVLTLHLRQPRIAASGDTFVAILGDGSIETWGRFQSDAPGIGSVRDQLRDVQDIQASSYAFAALLSDGSVVTWGSPGFGGDSSQVREQLRKVRQIRASQQAFAAILEDGSVVTWGSGAAAQSSSVREQLQNVQQIRAADQAFAAIRGDGSVVSWGCPSLGGDSYATV